MGKAILERGGARVYKMTMQDLREYEWYLAQQAGLGC